MSGDSHAEITQILSDLRSDDGDTAVARLLPLVYDELRALSNAYLASERPDHTLQATALVHEAYARLVRSGHNHWNDRAHFFRVAAKTMRRILVNHAVKHRTHKRGGGSRPVTVSDEMAGAEGLDLDVLALHEALSRLGEMDEIKGRVVELRFFGGATIEETAETLGISTASVERHWRFARAWLRWELDGRG